MTELAGVALVDKNLKLDSGAAFILTQRHTYNRVIQVNPDWEIEVCSSSPYVVARGKNATESTVFELAYEYVQIGLDLLSINHGIDLSVCNNSIEEHLIWWREGSTQVLRIIFVCNHNLKCSAFGFQRDSSGNIIPPPPIQKTEYHESLRYLRLAQATNDLFDSYRNMYLSLELLVSYIDPKRKDEKECVWLKRILTQPSPIFKTNKPFEKATITDIYKVRCSLFHAKEGKPVLVPYKLQDRKTVIKVLKKLRQIVLFLTETILNTKPIRRDGGLSISQDVFDAIGAEVYSNFKILVSDNDAMLSGADETINNIDYKLTVPLDTSYDDNFRKLGQKALFGVIAGSKLKTLKRITGLVLKKGEELGATAGLETALTYKSIDRLEALIIFKAKIIDV
ncbi:hypothetical protein [Coleofasciculus sp. FACHB-501]|uniref:hypothetical protein n=1 Tax=Cyanophyceae TaxID=3028117 RepID=UPI001689C079|nr:hypothetical protein [Coleofasciculus sp. FACHB-501]MBD1840253.1 hypothetical protein [Coleofasciculus sp. FACHB-501]